MKTAISVINKALALVRLELRPAARTIPELMSCSRRDSAGWIVEFIGAQGIGKSTLNEDTQRLLRQDWFFRGDLGQVGPAATPCEEVEQLHRDIYFRRIRALQDTQPDPWKSLTIARQMSKVISESLTIMATDFPRGFILDEGLFKNFPQEVQEFRAESPTPLWRNRAFVYLRARDTGFAVARYQGRAEDRSSRGLLQRRLTDAEVRARIERDNDLFGRMLEKAKKFGCPALIVHAEDNHQENIGRILAFCRELRAKTWTPQHKDTS